MYAIKKQRYAKDKNSNQIRTQRLNYSSSHIIDIDDMNDMDPIYIYLNINFDVLAILRFFYILKITITLHNFFLTNSDI